MSESNIEIKQIQNKTIKALSFQFLPLLIIVIAESIFIADDSESILDYLPTTVALITNLATIILLIYGYLLSFAVAFKYANYKGYPKYFGLVGIFNVFGLSFLFFLDDKNLAEHNSLSNNDFDNLSVSSILVSFLAIFTFFLPFIVIAIAIGGNVSIGEAFDYLENEDIANVLFLPIEFIFFWYCLKRIEITKINLISLIGSLKKIDLKLPFGLAIAEYFFAWGFNSVTLYSLSFFLPSYVENIANQEYTITYAGFFASAFSAIVFAPIWEEIFFRGLLFQKIAIKKSIKLGIFISAIIFAIIHFRYDVIPLFIGGVIYILLYLKTKQLIIPILSHFFYNLIVTVWMFHHQFISNYNHSIIITIADYREQFIDNLNSRILFVAFSAPYLAYFIYKNFPRNYDTSKLPYFANKDNLNDKYQ